MVPRRLHPCGGYNNSNNDVLLSDDDTGGLFWKDLQVLTGDEDYGDEITIVLDNLWDAAQWASMWCVGSVEGWKEQSHRRSCGQ